MGGSLVMSMMTGVPHGLWEHQAAERQQAQRQAECQKPIAP
jgi:hypothetical protein